MIPKVVLFDIDGTLIDTGGAGARSWRWAFEHLFGRAADIGGHSNAGMTDPVVARRTFTEVMGREPNGRELARLLAAYLSVLPDYVSASTGYRVLPGAEQLLERLSGLDVLLGITSGALEPAAHAKLGRAGLNHYFLVGAYGSDSEDRAKLTRRAIERAGRVLGERLTRAEVMVVGDTPLDIAAARAAGASAVGVASGRYDAAQLAAADADHVLAALTEPFPGLPVD